MFPLLVSVKVLAELDKMLTLPKACVVTSADKTAVWPVPDNDVV
jgi:hypothetical protein